MISVNTNIGMRGMNHEVQRKQAEKMPKDCGMSNMHNNTAKEVENVDKIPNLGKKIDTRA